MAQKLYTNFHFSLDVFARHEGFFTIFLNDCKQQPSIQAAAVSSKVYLRHLDLSQWRTLGHLSPTHLCPRRISQFPADPPRQLVPSRAAQISKNVSYSAKIKTTILFLCHEYFNYFGLSKQKPSGTLELSISSSEIN